MDKPDKSPLVAKINSILAENGILKKDFFEACGITSATYSLWNTGKTRPRDKIVFVIADYLEVDPSELFACLNTEAKVRPKKEKPTTQKGGELSPIRQEVWNLLNSMSDEKLEKALVILRTVKEM